MKAAVLCAKNDLRYGDYPNPEFKDDEVLIRVRASGICGSDVPRVLGDAAHFFPVVLGHEFSGEVAAIGAEVTGFEIGDKVTGAPLKPCHKCADCLNGHFSLCKHYSFAGSREQGSWAQYLALPAINVVKLSPDADFVACAFMEPVTVALHGLMLMGFDGGEIAIVGCGTIGLLALQCARLLGATSIVAIDVDDARIETAMQLGATKAFNTKTEAGMQEATVLGLKNVIETAGQEAAVKTCLNIAANRAKIMLIGTPTRPISFTVKEFELLNRKELILQGSWMSYSAPFPGKEWELAAKWLSSGEIQTNCLLHAVLPMSEVSKAFELIGTPGAVKGKIILEV